VVFKRTSSGCLLWVYISGEVLFVLYYGGLGVGLRCDDDAAARREQ
jgi:hypothetical protein